MQIVSPETHQGIAQGLENLSGFFPRVDDLDRTISVLGGGLPQVLAFL